MDTIQRLREINKREIINNEYRDSKRGLVSTETETSINNNEKEQSER